MTITVEPQQFSFVHFDAGLIERITRSMVEAIGIDRPVHVQIDESTPLGRVEIEIGPTIVIRAQSGALEDSKRPRQQSEVATSATIGRALLRVRDRLEGGFGEAPADDDLSLRQVAAWDTYLAARLQRLGLPVNRQRSVYNFRNRHGFTDVADAAFERIWQADGLTWGELESISEAGVAS
ncbi:MAG: hypothetical protein RLZ14_239 [Actinomycetota bacterium]|jgi:hypothetical protein